MLLPQAYVTVIPLPFVPTKLPFDPRLFPNLGFGLEEYNPIPAIAGDEPDQTRPDSWASLAMTDIQPAEQHFPP
jgi:hypothetical protein